MSEPEKEAEGQEAKPKSKKKLIIIIVVVVLAAAGAAFALMGGGDKKDGEEHAEEEVRHYKTAELETFIVNLSDHKSFLKVKMLLEYDPKIFELAHGHGGSGGGGGSGSGGGGGGNAMPQAMADRLPMVRDSIIRVLSSKKSEELLTVDGKERLKEELLEAINEAIGLDEAPIVGIYFTEFIIQ